MYFRLQFPNILHLLSEKKNLSSFTINKLQLPHRNSNETSMGKNTPRLMLKLSLNKSNLVASGAKP
jgi:hypothetical protein